jgi:hypothetical protein
MSTTEAELQIESGGGRLVVFSKETGVGVRIELKRRLVIIDAGEARRVARWLLQAADSMERQDERG